MLGAIGFLVLMIAIGTYAYTSSMNYQLVPIRERRLFVTAYSILALTALVWLGTFFASETVLSELVFMTDIMLVAATVCILGVILDISKPLVLAGITLVGASLLTLRAFAFPPKAFISDGLLNFNLSQTESLIIGLIFLVIWLPATVKVVYLAFTTPRLLPFRGLVSFVFIATVLMTSFFLSARRPAVIIISFVSIILFFATLSGINLLVVRAAQTPKKKVRHG